MHVKSWARKKRQVLGEIVGGRFGEAGDIIARPPGLR